MQSSQYQKPSMQTALSCWIAFPQRSQVGSFASLLVCSRSCLAKSAAGSSVHHQDISVHPF